MLIKGYVLLLTQPIFDLHLTYKTLPAKTYGLRKPDQTTGLDTCLLTAYLLVFT